ncbi:unnamed protein product [Urochloa humidicola]
MAREGGRFQRGPELGEGSKRRPEEGRFGDRQAMEGNWGYRNEEEYRRDSFNKERFGGERGANPSKEGRPFREEEQGNKRRYVDHGDNRGNYQRQDQPRNRNLQERGNVNISVHDRLGGGYRDYHGRERDTDMRGRGSGHDNARMANRQKDEDICFWCRQGGHHQADCTNPPFCFRCKETGHIAARCPTTKGCSMHLYGYGFPGQGFYCLKIPGQAKQQQSELLGSLKITSGAASVERMDEELRNMIDSKWQWNVRQISETEFLANFPNKQILDALSKSNGVNFALHNITALVAHSSMDPAAASVLQTGWVQMQNVPTHARSVEASTLIAELAGDVVAIDELTLIREGPVRAKISGRNIASLRGILEIFINGVGYDIKFIAEQQGNRAPDPPQPPPKKPKDDYCDEEEEDDSYDSEFDGKHGRKSHSGKGEGQVNNQQKGQSSSGGKKCKELANVLMEDITDIQSKENVEASGKPIEAQPVSMYNPKTKDLVIFDQENEEGGQKEDEFTKSTNKRQIAYKRKHNTYPNQGEDGEGGSDKEKKSKEGMEEVAEQGTDGGGEFWSQESFGCEESELMRVEESEDQGAEAEEKDTTQGMGIEEVPQEGHRAQVQQGGLQENSTQWWQQGKARGR